MLEDPPKIPGNPDPNPPVLCVKAPKTAPKKAKKRAKKKA